MTHIRTTVFLLSALLLLLLLPCGCGGDDDSFEDADDGLGREGEMLLIPSVSVAGFDDEGQMTTAQEAITLTGAALYADSVTVNDVEVELGEEFADDAVGWSMDVTLTEGSNALQIKAVDADGLESESLDVVVVYDPDYVPDPPENTGVGFTRCTVNGKVGWKQRDHNYDPSGSRPDEIYVTVSSTIGSNIFYARSRANWTVGFGTLSMVLDMAPNSALDVRFEMEFGEEDSGLLGSNDYIGYGAVSKRISFQPDKSTNERLHTTIDGNTVWVDLSTSCGSVFDG